MSNLNKFNREYLKNPKLSKVNNKDTNVIRIAQWNVFAQGFVQADNFQYCKPSDLTWPKREKLFRQELMFLSADIYCFQEADIHRNLLQIINENYNSSNRFQNIFVPKAESPCLLYPDNFGPDGLSVIYDTEKFRVTNSRLVRLDKSANYIAVIFSVEVLNIIGHDNKPQMFIIATTHLKSKHQFSQVRLEQLASIMLELHKFIEEIGRDTPVIFTGDFNCTPEEKQTFSTLHSSPSATDTSHNMEFVDVYKMFYSPDLLRSPNKLLNIQNGENNIVEPYFTTWMFRKEESKTKRKKDESQTNLKYIVSRKREVTEIIDYIFYANPTTPNPPHRIEPLGILAIPDKQEIGQYGIPYPQVYPSDHVALLVDFLFVNPNTYNI